MKEKTIRKDTKYKFLLLLTVSALSEAFAATINNDQTIYHQGYDLIPIENWVINSFPGELYYGFGTGSTSTLDLYGVLDNRYYLSNGEEEGIGVINNYGSLDNKERGLSVLNNGVFNGTGTINNFGIINNNNSIYSGRAGTGILNNSGTLNNNSSGLFVSGNF